MAQHDALRRALRSRGEQHDRRVVGALAPMTGPRASAIAASARSRANDADLAADVFEIEHGGLRRERGDHRLELGLLDEGRAVTTSAISAALHADCAAAGPVEKFSIAGTRPSACRAKNVTTDARDVGSSTPTRSPATGALREHAAEREARRDQPAVAHAAVNSMSSAIG